MKRLYYFTSVGFLVGLLSLRSLTCFGQSTAFTNTTPLLSLPTIAASLFAVLLEDTPLAGKVVVGVIVGLICFFLVIFGLGKIADGFHERPPDWGKAIIGGIMVFIAITLGSAALL